MLFFADRWQGTDELVATPEAGTRAKLPRYLAGGVSLRWHIAFEGPWRGLTLR